MQMRAGAVIMQYLVSYDLVCSARQSFLLLLLLHAMESNTSLDDYHYFY